MAAQSAMTSSTADAMIHTEALFQQGTGELATILREREGLRARRADLMARIQQAEGAQGGSLDAIAQRASASGLRQDLQAVSQRLDGLDLQISRQFPAYAELTRPLPLSATDTRALLNSDEAVLLILPAPDATYIWALNGERAEWARSSLSEGDITKGVQALRRNLDPGPGAPQVAFDGQTAWRLYQEFILPLEPLLKGRKVVFVAASGALQSLPLSVLVTAPPGEGAAGATPWLIDRYALVTLPAVTSLHSLRCLSAARPHAGCKGATATSSRKSATTIAYAGLGGPSLSGADANSRGPADIQNYFRGGLADPDLLRALNPLPGARAEIGALAGLFQRSGAFTRTGDDFTETLVKSSPELKRAAILHFASHALMGGQGGASGEPGIVMTPPAEGRATPLDDGLLTASEAAALDIKADLVALSACNTARANGDLGAEGLSGLARSFFFAGAKSLMVSHWSVDDASTRELMVSMFQAGGSNRAIALQGAIRRLKAQPRFSEPRFWAPFVLVGEART